MTIFCISEGKNILKLILYLEYISRLTWVMGARDKDYIFLQITPLFVICTQYISFSVPIPPIPGRRSIANIHKTQRTTVSLV